MRRGVDLDKAESRIEEDERLELLDSALLSWRRNPEAMGKRLIK
jgi:hypothetical protein